MNILRLSPWLLVAVASGFEIAFALGLKFSTGFTKPLPSVLTVMAATASFLILSQALRQLPVGTAYAVWTGIGAVGSALLGLYLFHEPATFARLGSIALIIAGIISLKLAGGN